MRLLRRNVLAIYGGYATAVASGLILTPIIVHALGKTEYGLWAFIGSVTVFLGLLDVGVGPSVVRFAAFERGRGDRGDPSSVASAALVVYGAVALVTVPFAVGVAWLVPVLLEVPDDLVWPARIATLLVAGTVLLRFPLGLGHSLLLGSQRFDVINFGNIVGLVLYTGLVIGLVAGRGDIVLLGGLALAAAFVRFALPLAWLPREFPSLRLSRRLVTREKLRELLGFSWHNFLIHLAGKVVFSTDVIVVGIVLGAEAAALYAVPAKLFAVAASAGTAGTNLLYPALSELEGRDDEARQRGLVLAGLRVGMLVMLVLALPLVLVPDLLIEAWVGSGFGESAPVLALLGVALALHQPIHVLSQYLVARGWQAPVAQVSTVLAAVNLVLSVVLALTVGIWGVALATAVTEAIRGVWLVPRLAARASGLRAGEFARAALRPVAPTVAVAVAVFVVLARTLDPAGPVAVGLLGAVWLLLAAAVGWRLGIGRAERAALRRMITPRVPAAGAASMSEPLS